MPASLYFPTAALVIAATLVSSLKRSGTLDESSGGAVWSFWNDFLGLIGVSSLTQVNPKPPQPLCKGHIEIYF